MDRARQIGAGLVVAVTFVAGLATVFPDTFAIKGTPPLGTALRTMFALALPVALCYGLLYLVILDRRLKRLARDQRVLAARIPRDRPLPEIVPEIGTKAFTELASEVVANLPPVRPPSN